MWIPNHTNIRVRWTVVHERKAFSKLSQLSLARLEAQQTFHAQRTDRHLSDRQIPYARVAAWLASAEHTNLSASRYGNLGAATS